MMPMTERFAVGIRRYIDTPRLDLVADPRDALIAAQAEQIAVLEALVADLRKQLDATERAGSRNSGNSSMPPSSDDLPGRKPPRKQRRAAESAEKRRGKQPGSPGTSMTWKVPDRTEDHYPEGSCSCGRDLADAEDLGVTRSFQQEEIPAAPAERVQHDLHEARCACGRAHVAVRPAGVPDSALSIGPRLRALAVYLVVFQHVPVERCRQLIADVSGAAVSAGFIHSCLRQAARLAAGVVRLIRTLITAAAVAGFDETTLRSGRPGRRSTSTARSPSSTPPSGWAPAAWTPCTTPGSCAEDTSVWPTNNISERGVRPLKTQQKISGRLASDDVTQDRLDIRSYIDTARKHGKNAMDVLHGLMLGRPWRPPAQAFSP